MAAAAAIVSLLIYLFPAQEAPLLTEVVRLESIGSVSSVHGDPSGRLYFLLTSAGERGWCEPTTGIFNRTGGVGWGLDGLDDPRGIWFDALSVYVADRNNDRVVRYDKELRPLSEFSTRDTSYAPAQFGYPQAVAVNERGDLGVLDGENNELVVFDRTGRFLFRFGREPRSGSPFESVRDLAAGAGGTWIVLDSRHLTIIDMFGTREAQRAHDLADPIGVDSDGDIIVLGGRSKIAFWTRADDSWYSIPVRTFNLSDPNALISDVFLQRDLLSVVLNGTVTQFRVEDFRK